MLQGATELLERCRPPLLIEVGADPEAPDSAAGQVFSLLEEAGYSAYCMHEGTVRKRQQGERAVDYLFLTPTQAAELA